MAKRFLVNIDLKGNQLLNAAMQPSGSAPNAMSAGQIYYDNSGTGKLFFSTAPGTANWVEINHAGVQGLQGNTGAQGVQGTQGINGLQGVQGTEGHYGVDGSQGTTGTQGTQGVKGLQGVQGTNGIQGFDGTQGTQGIQGTQGTEGTQGIQGTGFTFRGSYLTATNYFVNDVVTDNGQTWLCIQTIDSVVPSESTWWTLWAAKGIQGTDGTQGIQGFDGTQGVQGIQGYDGAQGIQGFDGTQGIQGLYGIQGFYGVQGTSGSDASVSAGNGIQVISGVVSIDETYTATRAYVDAVAQGLFVLGSARAASDANIDLTGTTSIVGGVTLADLDRVLIKDQDTATENGIYIYDIATTSLIASTNLEDIALKEGSFVFVEEGVNAARGYIVTNYVAGATTWTQFSAAGEYTAGTGISIQGTSISLDTANGYGSRIYSTVIQGTQSATSFTIAHNFNTKAISARVYDAIAGDDVEVDITRPTVNTIAVGFASAPTDADFYGVVVLG